MNIDLSSFAFGSSLRDGAGTASWGTALGQSQPDYKFTYPGAEAIVIAMAYCAVPLDRVHLPLGRGGHVYNAAETTECLIASLFRKVYINGQKVDYPFIMVLIKEESNSHTGRRSIKYSEKNTYNGGGESFSNQEFLVHARQTLNIGDDGCWFVYGIETKNQDELHLYAVVVDEHKNVTYENSTVRRRVWLNLIPDNAEGDSSFGYHTTSARDILSATTISQFFPYLTALRTKPFMLLAGISGTGKSRIVREMAKACWKEGDEEFGKNCPRNFCMVQVKPNWHDSSELIGYVSRLNGEKFVVGPFLRFLSAALKEPKVPYFLCLDEMNLAPVEQYFAEYLSVIESRKVNIDPVSGQTIIETDPIIPYENTEAYGSLIDQLFDSDEERKAYKTEEGGKRLTIPQNLFVVGTVNMDETTFSFSRKVLDRAMTIEMNEVDLHGGLEKGTDNEIGYIADSIIGDAAEGCDVYEENKELCDEVLAYLEQVNAILEGTPFKIAYRTRNEFLMYAVNRRKLAPDSQLWQTLDEMTSMKILSRIEGDSDRTKDVLERLKALVEEEIVAKMNNITGLAPSHPVDTGEAPVLPSKTGEAPVHPSDTGETPVFPGEATIFPSKTGETPVLRKSISAKKIEEMLAKLEGTGFTSYWA